MTRYNEEKYRSRSDRPRKVNGEDESRRCSSRSHSRTKAAEEKCFESSSSASSASSRSNSPGHKQRSSSSRRRPSSSSRRPSSRSRPRDALASLRTSLLESKLQYRELKSTLRRARTKHAALERDLSALRDRRAQEKEEKHRRDMEVLSAAHLTSATAAGTRELAAQSAAQEAVYGERERRMAQKEQVLRVDLHREAVRITQTQNALLELQERYARTKKELVKEERDRRNQEQEEEAERRQMEEEEEKRRDKMSKIEEVLRKEEEAEELEEKFYPLPRPPIKKRDPFIATSSVKASTTIPGVRVEQIQSSSSKSSQSKSSRRGVGKQPVIQVITDTDRGQEGTTGGVRREVTVEVSPERGSRRRSSRSRSAREDDGRKPSAISTANRQFQQQGTQSFSSRTSSRQITPPNELERDGDGGDDERKQQQKDDLVQVKITTAPTGESQEHTSAATAEILKRLERSERNLDEIHSAVRRFSKSPERRGGRERRRYEKAHTGVGVDVTRDYDASGARRVKVRLTPRKYGAVAEDREEKDESGSSGSSSRSRSRSRSPSSAASEDSSHYSPTRIIIRASAQSDPTMLPLRSSKLAEDEEEEEEKKAPTGGAKKSALKKAKPTPPASPPRKAHRVLPGANRAFMSQTSNSLKRQRELIEMKEKRKKAFVRPKVEVSKPEPLAKKKPPTAATKKRSASAAPPSVRRADPQPITLKLEVEAEPGRARARTPPPTRFRMEREQAEMGVEERMKLEESETAKEEGEEEERAYQAALAAREKALAARKERREALKRELLGIRDSMRKEETIFSPRHQRARTSALSPASTSSTLSPLSAGSSHSLTPRTPVLPPTPPTPVPDPAGRIALDPFPSTTGPGGIRLSVVGSPSSTTQHLLALHARREWEEQEREKRKELRLQQKKQALEEYQRQLAEHYARAREREQRHADRVRRKKLLRLRAAEEAKNAELLRLQEQEKQRRAEEERKASEEKWKRRYERLTRQQRLRELEKSALEKEAKLQMAAAQAEREKQRPRTDGTSVRITSTPCRDGSLGRIVIDTHDGCASSELRCFRERDRDREYSDAKRLARIAAEEVKQLEKERELIVREQESQLVLELERARAASRERRRREEEADEEAALLLRRQRKMRRKEEERLLLEEEDRRDRKEKERRRHAASPTLSTRERLHQHHAKQLESQLDQAHTLSQRTAEAQRAARHSDLLGGLVSNGPGLGLRPYGQALSSWSQYAYPTSSGLWPSVAAYSGMSGASAYGAMPVVGGAQVYPYYTPPDASAAPPTAAAQPSSHAHHSYIVDASSLGPVKPGDLIYDPVKQQYVQVEEEVQVHVAPGPTQAIPTATAGPTSFPAPQPVSSVTALLNRLQATAPLWNA